MEKYSEHPLAGAKDLDSATVILWSFYKKYFIGLYIISVITSLITNYISSSIDMTSLSPTTEMTEMLAIYKANAVPLLLVFAVSVVFGIIMHAYVLDKPLNKPYNFIDTLRKSAIAFFPYIIVIIILGIGGVILISIGTVLFVLPGIFAIFYFVTLCLFVLPVALTESRNPGYLIGRSLQLTHRNFWPNLGWVSVMLLLLIIVSIIIAGLISLPFTGSFLKAITDPAAAEAAKETVMSPLYIILSSLAGALVTPILPIMAFIIYFRNANDKSETVTPANNDEGRVRVEDLYPKMPENND